MGSGWILLDLESNKILRGRYEALNTPFLKENRFHFITFDRSPNVSKISSNWETSVLVFDHSSIRGNTPVLLLEVGYIKI